MSAPVAIVGIGCRFPGGVVDAASFWRLLRDGVDAITEIPPSRIDIGRWYDPRPTTPGRMAAKWGGFLDRIDELDAAFFKISPREAERLDPQQRVLLESAWEALEDAGIDPLGLDGSRTGVFVGQWVSDFESRLFAHPDELDFFMTQGSGRYATSGRLSYFLGLRGPSLTLDTACSSSLVTVHLACQSLRSGESELALAGGVNLILQPHINIAYSQSRMMATAGRCRFGDAAGDGYVRSEGAGLVALKLLDRALADGDLIHAVVRGSSVNNDGRSSGVLGRPSQIGHEEMLRTAYADAGVAASRVGLVEAHGTGTRAGDPVELAALAAVLGPGRPAGERCWIGSVKTNIGHTEGAAGIAGLIKATLALETRQVPVSLHFETPNPSVPWDDQPFTIPTAHAAWPDGDTPRIAGVNSFGIAGTNAHVVLEEAPVTAAATAAPTRPLSLLVLSAKTPEALRALADRYADLLESDPAPALHDVCWSAATRRAQLEIRAAFVAADAPAMAATLRRHAAGEPARVAGAVAPDAAPARVAFVVPGQGAQWQGMARELLEREPVFRAALERCDAAARRHVEWSILEQLAAEPGTPAYRLDQIDVIQPVLLSLAIGYAELWRALGVEPHAVVGHSMGEVGAAHLAGAIDLDAAMQIICRRSALMRRTSGRGAMALVELSLAEARARIAGREDRLSVAVENAPRSSVISGEPEAVAQVLAELGREQIFCRPVKVDVASHSPQMEPLAAELQAELSGLVPAETRVPIVSTVLGRRAAGPELGAAYWARNLRQPVLFATAVKQLLADGITMFVELGPHPILLPPVQQTAQAMGRAVTTVSCGRREEPEQASFLEALAGLWVAGAPIDWRKVMPEGGRTVRLPLYPWQRERHWAEVAELGAPASSGRPTRARPDDDSLGWLHRLQWEDAGDPPPPPAPRRWLVVDDGRGQGATELTAALGGETCTLDGLGAALARRPTAVAVLAGDGPDTPYLPVRVLQAVLASPARPRLWLVTRGAQATAAGMRVSVDQAALWGAARVVGEEHPDLWGGLVDRDAAGDASLLAAHLASPGGEDQIALRAGRRLALRLVTAKDFYAPPRSWRPDAAYLVTGGLGGIGLHVARAMVAEGARRLIFLARTPLPPRATWGASDDARIAAVRELEAAGAAVHTASVDVGDEAQLRGFLDAYAAEAWPPIRGVVHLAGALRNQLAGTMDRATFDAATAAKLGGARLLDRLLPELDHFILFSSTGAFLPQAGQANYAAANAGLDALAQDRVARGLPALSIGWGVWAGTGLVNDEAGARNVAELARQGVGSFSPERGTALFSWLRGRREGVAVLPLDRAAFARGRARPLFQKLLPSSGGAGETLADRLASATAAERRQLVEGAIRESVGKVLQIAPSRLDPRRVFGELGLNSLMAMELRNRLEAALGRPLSATVAWNYPTVTALVEHLAGDAPPAATATPAAPEPSAQLTQIAELSDEEAALALRAQRRSRGPA